MERYMKPHGAGSAFRRFLFIASLNFLALAASLFLVASITIFP